VEELEMDGSGDDKDIAKSEVNTAKQ